MSFNQNCRLVLVFCLIIVVLFFDSCIEKDTPPVVFMTSTVSDAEGNIYKTVKIGDQWWMQEDLKVTKFQNGTPIQLYNGFDKDNWSTTNKPGYSIGPTGFLYNFFAVNDVAKIAPVGWHVATDEEWQKMESYLGMQQVELRKVNWRGTNEGDKLKQSYQEADWVFYKDVWGTNESGFQALPCGCRLFDGRSCDPANQKQGFWWTATPSEKEAWYRNLDYKNSQIFRYFVDQNYGFAVRCVKD